MKEIPRGLSCESLILTHLILRNKNKTKKVFTESKHHKKAAKGEQIMGNILEQLFEVKQKTKPD